MGPIAGSRHRGAEAEPDVLLDGRGEEEGVLGHHADERAQLTRVRVAHIDAIDQDAPARYVVDPGDQRHNRRLARAGGTDDRHGLTRIGGERDVLEDQPFGAGIAERHILEFHGATGLGDTHGSVGRTHRWLGLEDLVEPAHAG